MVLSYSFIAEVVFLLAGGILAIFSLYLLALAIAAFFYRDTGGAAIAVRPRRIVVVIPAHDEAGSVGRCVDSIRAQICAHEVEIVVVADNCSDATASLAALAGARVMIRDDPHARGKGQALRWAFDRLLTESPPPDAMVVVDADVLAEPGFLARLCRPFEEGAAVVQGESLLIDDGLPHVSLRSAALLLVNRVQMAGRAVLGLPCDLSGAGMLFTRALLQELPWNAFTSAEDAEYTIALRRAGIGPVFARGAIVCQPAAPNRRAAEAQQLRWEGGKLHLARTHVPRLVADAVRQRNPSYLDMAFTLALPPVGFLAAGATIITMAGGLLAATGALPWWTIVPSAIALGSIPLYVLIGLRAGQAPATAYRSLIRAPLFVCTKLLSAHRLLRFRADSWVRTERPDDRLRSNLDEFQIPN
jgi:cellulose synthase/poly-beta-1,6-N-acetylglucosamine synthase-like glycosyltransferase